MTNTNTLTLAIDANTSLEVRVMHIEENHFRAFVRSIGESSFHISRASGSSPGAAIECALHAAGWWDWCGLEVNAPRVLAAIEARRTGPILEAGRHGYHGVWVHPVVKADA